MATERKLDIFKLLNAVDKKNYDWFSKQSDDAQKEFAPSVAMRWLSTLDNIGMASEYMLVMVNERVNDHLWDYSKHPDLVYRLMASCGLGSTQKHQWLSPQKRKNEGGKAFELLQKHNQEVNEDELDFLMSGFSKEEFSQYVDDCGIDKTEAKEILKSFNKYKENIK